MKLRYLPAFALLVLGVGLGLAVSAATGYFSRTTTEVQTATISRTTTDVVTTTAGNATSQALAEYNVRSAIPVAEGFYQTGSTYTGMTSGALQAQAPAPGLAPTLVVRVSADGNAYCLSDTQGSKSAYYVGGDQNIGGDGKGFKTDTAMANSTIETGGTCSVVGTSTTTSSVTTCSLYQRDTHVIAVVHASDAGTVCPAMVTSWTQAYLGVYTFWLWQPGDRSLLIDPSSNVTYASEEQKLCTAIYKTGASVIVYDTGQLGDDVCHALAAASGWTVH